MGMDQNPGVPVNGKRTVMDVHPPIDGLIGIGWYWYILNKS